MEYLGVIVLFGGLFVFNKFLAWYFEPYFIKYGMINYHLTEGEDVCIIGEAVILVVSPAVTIGLMVMIVFMLVIILAIKTKDIFLSYEKKKDERVREINKTSS